MDEKPHKRVRRIVRKSSAQSGQGLSSRNYNRSTSIFQANLSPNTPIRSPTKYQITRKGSMTRPTWDQNYSPAYSPSPSPEPQSKQIKVKTLKVDTFNSRRVKISRFSLTPLIIVHNTSDKNTESSNGVGSSPSKTPEVVIDQNLDHLTANEKQEIMQYDRIYYFSKPDNSPGLLSPGIRQIFPITLGDQILYRYEILEIIGKGTFGEILRCLDHKTNKQVAIKVFKNQDNQAIQLEVQILQQLSGEMSCENIVKLYKAFVFRGHYCIVQELLGCSLYDYITKFNPGGLPMNIVRIIAKQILEGLCEIHSQRIIHCDIKPDNIMLADLDSLLIKIIDFGTACYKKNTIYTYLQSRYYRAPEVIMGGFYSTPIDIWSMACVLVELLTGQVLFKGKNEHEVTKRIVEIIGFPPRKLVKDCPRANRFFIVRGIHIVIKNEDGELINTESCPLEQLLPGVDGNFLNFLSSCLVWREHLRPTAKMLLEHPWITEV